VWSQAPDQKAVPVADTAGAFSFSYTIKNNALSFTVSYPGDCWVAVGFNPGWVMKNANIVIGTIVNGASMVSDEFGDGMFSHKPDTLLKGTNDLISGTCSVQNNVTTLTFSIPLNSGDKKDCLLESGKTVKLIFAAGQSTDKKKKHAVALIKSIIL